MKKLLSICLRGVLVLAPIGLTFYIIFKLYEILDGIFKSPLQKIGIYFPGLGLIVTLIVIFVAGVLASNWITNKLIYYIDRLLTKVPMLGNIYSIIKDTINSFSSNKKGFNRLVRVTLPNDICILGFLTSEQDGVFVPDGYVAVYLMQSMQWAGNLILVPNQCIEEIDVPAEDALKFIASAGLLKATRQE